MERSFLRLFVLPFILLSVLLGACVPTAQVYPPDIPITYPTSYRNLFDTTLQTLTAAYVPDGLSRRTFSVTQADPQTGLITAVRNERGPSSSVQYRYRFPEDDADIGDRRGSYSFFSGLGLAFSVPVQRSSPEQTIITVVIRPTAAGASLIYSTQGPDGTSSNDGTRLMRSVLENLNARFLTSETAPPAKP